MKLYNRDGLGNIRTWEIKHNDDFTAIILSYGIICKNKIIESVPVVPINSRETFEIRCKKDIASRIHKQRKGGYRQLEEFNKDVYDQCIGTWGFDFENNEANVFDVFKVIIPRDNVDINGFTKPMLCKNKKHINVDYDLDYIAQPKVNGLRCTIKIEQNRSNSFFATRDYKFRFTSREGIQYTVNHINELLHKKFDQETLKLWMDLGIELDGEFYIPGYPINVINSAVKNKLNPLHKKVQFWLFDIVHPDMPQSARFTFIDETFDFPVKSASLEDHMLNTDFLAKIERVGVYNDTEAEYLRDLYIDRGFEGIVMRMNNGQYQYGKKNKTMLKYKAEKEGEFVIVDVIPEGSSRSYIAKFVLQNDVNDETFMASINVPIAMSIEILKNRENYIGKMANVVYRERSGVFALPFHAKARIIRDEEEIDFNNVNP